MDREVRIALIMGGGVSLGSFSGGALAETLRLLEQFPATRRDAQGTSVPIAPRIDVVTGASAGSMTLGIMLRLLLAGKSASEVAEAMQASWVEGVGLDYDEADKQLLPADLKHHAEPSLLSTAALQRLANRYLGEGTGTDFQRSDLLAERIYASFAVANLHGIDVEAPVQLIRQWSAGGSASGSKSGFEDALKTTFHDDRVRFRIEAAGSTTGGPAIDPESGAIRIRKLGDPSQPGNPWSIFRAAAIASGSFPAAFPPVFIERRREEYPGLWPDDLEEEHLEKFRFAYVDGGTFRNEPLREAIELAALCDAASDPESFERVFVLIDPNVSGSNEVRTLDFEHAIALSTKYDDESGRIKEHELEQRHYAGRLLSVLARVLAMIQSQATLRDWLRAAKINSRVEWERKLTEILTRLSALEGSAALLGEARAMLTEIYLDKVARAPTGEADAATRASAERRRDADLEALEKELGPVPNELARTLVLALRNAAGLRRKRRLNMVAISPWSVPDPPIPLAGNFLANFGGFFDQGWRQHDYDAGRFAAHYMLTLKIGDDVDRLIRTGVAQPVPRRGLDEDPRLKHVRPEVRKRFLETLREHVENLAHAVGIPDFLDDALSRIVTGELESALGKPAVTSRHIVVRVRGGIKKDYELKRSSTGSTAHPVERPDGSRVMETVVEARMQEDLPEDERYSLAGPHLLWDEGRPYLWMVSNTLFTKEKSLLKVRLNGAAKDWFDAARRERLLEIEWQPKVKNRSMRPRDLRPF